jgi:hypothetical protein
MPKNRVFFTGTLLPGPHRVAVRTAGRAGAEYAEDGYVCSPGQKCTGPHSFGTFCRTVFAVPHGYAAVRFDVDLDGTIFYPCRE